MPGVRGKYIREKPSSYSTTNKGCIFSLRPHFVTRDEDGVLERKVPRQSKETAGSGVYTESSPSHYSLALDTARTMLDYFERLLASTVTLGNPKCRLSRYPTTDLSSPRQQTLITALYIYRTSFSCVAPCMAALASHSLFIRPFFASLTFFNPKCPKPLDNATPRNKSFLPFVCQFIIYLVQCFNVKFPYLTMRNQICFQYFTEIFMILYF